MGVGWGSGHGQAHTTRHCHSFDNSGTGVGRPGSSMDVPDGEVHGDVVGLLAVDFQHQVLVHVPRRVVRRQVVRPRFARLHLVPC